MYVPQYMYVPGCKRCKVVAKWDTSCEVEILYSVLALPHLLQLREGRKKERRNSIH